MHLKSTPEGAMQRKCSRRKEVETTFSRSQMEQSRSLEANSVWEHPPQPGERPERGQEQEILEGKSDELRSPTQLQDDSTRDDEEATSGLLDNNRRIRLWSSRCTPSQSVRAASRSTSYSVEVHRRYHVRHWTYCWRKISKIIGTWVEKKNYQMHGLASQDSFYWTKGHLTDTHGPGGDLRGNKQPLVQTLYGQICGSFCLMQRKRKQNKDGLSRNQSSTMPDN